MSAINDDIKGNKLIAAAGYLWILCLLPLLKRPESKFAGHHGRQGFLLFALSIGLWIISWLPLVGWIIWLAGTLVLLILSVIGVITALTGKFWEMPLLGRYAKKIII